MALKYYRLTEVSFIGGALLAAGSIVTSQDLGTYTDPADGKEKEVKPGSALVEVDEAGKPKTDAGARALQAVLGNIAPMEIAAVAPFSPNPTRPQGAPTQAPGGLSLAENDLPQTAPAQGVESDEAAQARGEQAEKAAEAVQAMTAGQPKPEKPQRRDKQ